MPSQLKPAPSAPPRREEPPSATLHVLPQDLGPLMAQRPLIQGERAEDYDELLARVASAVGPTDVIEAVWVRDIVDLIWEGQRLRRLKASLLMLARRQAVMRLLDRSHGPVRRPMTETQRAIVNEWLAGDEHGAQHLADVLAERGLDLDSVMAQALSDRIRQVERMEQMIASAEARRQRALAELDRRREALARRLRALSPDITDIA